MCVLVLLYTLHVCPRSIVCPHTRVHTALTELRLDCNRILFVPKDVGYMTHLHALKLSYNRIHFLPVELGELKMLKEIGLQYR